MQPNIASLREDIDARSFSHPFDNGTHSRHSYDRGILSIYRGDFESQMSLTSDSAVDANQFAINVFCEAPSIFIALDVRDGELESTPAMNPLLLFDQVSIKFVPNLAEDDVAHGDLPLCCDWGVLASVSTIQQRV